jgi:hypothetical protein
MKFQPGQSGNPKGRPKGAENKSTQAIAEALDTGIDLDSAILKLKELIDEGNLNAIKLYFAYRFGKPREMVVIEIPEVKQFVIVEAKENESAKK